MEQNFKNVNNVTEESPAVADKAQNAALQPIRRFTSDILITSAHPHRKQNKRYRQ